jgi:hypothetical protein
MTTEVDDTDTAASDVRSTLSRMHCKKCKWTAGWIILVGLGIAMRGEGRDPRECPKGGWHEMVEEDKCGSAELEQGT